MESDQCVSCEHFDSLDACKAFPDGIPEEIFTGEFDHAKPYKNDNGIRWTPVDKETEELYK